MRKIVPKTSFLGGEAGQLLEGRSDLVQFQLGAQHGGLRNFITLKGGGITRRPPTNYVKITQGNADARLFPFITDLNVTSGQFILEIADPGSTTLTFRVIRVSGSNPVLTPTGASLTVARAAANEAFSLNDIQVTQHGLRLFIACKGFEPQILTMTPAAESFIGGGLGAGTPTFALIPFIAAISDSRDAWFSMPYRSANISSTTIAVSNAAVGVGRTLTASTAIFSQSHIGAYFRHTESGVTGYCRITAVGGSPGTLQTTATVDVVKAFNSTGASTNWAEGAWSEYRGWPRTIAQYNGRLCFGGNTSEPDTIWMSQVDDDLQMHAESSGLADPINVTLRSEVGHQIQWMIGGKKLTIGTTNSEWVGVVTDDGTNLSLDFDEETNHGSLPIKPHKYGYSIPFVQRYGESVREMTFDLDQSSYVTTDLNLFGSHVGSVDESGDSDEIKELAFQEGPFSTLWVRVNGGVLYGLTRDRQQQIAAWHSQVFGGSTSRGCISVCVMKDTLWVVVKRTINGVETRFVEYMQDPESRPGLTQQIFLDCQKYSSGVSATVWSGFSHFANHTAYVVAYNADDVIVQAGSIAVDGSGQITLDVAATDVVVGFHADAILRLLPFEGGRDPELYQCSMKAADTVAIRLHQTWGLYIGKNRIHRITGWEEQAASTFEPIPFSSNDPVVDTFTGVKEVKVPSDTGHDGSFALAMRHPWPCTILSLCSKVVGHEV